MKASKVSLFVIASGIVLGSNAYADSRVKTKYTTAGQSTETTVYTKDSRQRFDAGPGVAMINQCDVQRSIQLFEQRKSYMVFPTGGQSMQPGTQIRSYPLHRPVRTEEVSPWVAPSAWRQM